MDELKHGKFIVVSIHTEREEKTSISSVDYFMISEFKEASHFVVSADNRTMGLDFDLLAVGFIVSYIPAG